MSSPFPSELVASPKGVRIAWVFDLRGERNVWLAEGSGFEARQLTRYAGDDGQSISSLVFTPDGETLLFVRGSETNRSGEVGTPTSDVEQRKQQVWAVNIADGTPRLLGDMNCQGEGCEDLQVSPDGKQVLWTARRQIWVAPIAGDKPARPLFFARGSSSRPRWSPDGKQVAFVSDREDHRFIGVYAVGSATLRWVAPSADRDNAPVWSPDGTRLAFLRVPGEQMKRAILPLHPNPFSIFIANIAAAASAPAASAAPIPAKEIYRSANDLNGSLPPDAVDMFVFTAADRIVFSSEADGWRHLYSIPATGGTPSLLTPGNFEVEQAALTTDLKSVLYTSNQDDVDRRHVWRVPAGGGNPERLTHGETINWSPAETAEGGHIVFLGSTATSPAMPHRLSGRNREMIARAALPADFPSQHLVTPQQVIFKTADGYTIHAQLFLPRAAANAAQEAARAGAVRRPAIIFTHGGPQRHMMLGFHNRKYYHHSYAANQFLASRGYVVLSVNYRLGTMYGRAFRQVADGGWRGGSEYNDVLAAAQYLLSRADVDPARIGLWGGSYGGYLTALGLARNSDQFAAGVDLHGVHDWSVLRGREDAPDAEKAREVSFNASPVAAMETWRSPVLLIHGDDDRNVNFNQTTDLVQRLRARGVEFEQIVFPDEIHSFLLWKNWITAYAAMGDFFDRKLKSPAPAARPPARK